MKIRLGHVSNSSSSSFIIAFKKDADFQKVLERNIDEVFKIDEDGVRNSRLFMFYDNIREHIIDKFVEAFEDGTRIRTVGKVDEWCDYDKTWDEWMKNALNNGGEIVVLSLDDRGNGGDYTTTALADMLDELDFANKEIIIRHMS